MKKLTQFSKTVVIASMIFTFFTFSSCTFFYSVYKFLYVDKEYGGEYPELYSVAINSLLGVRGYGSSEQPFESIIEVIEEDNFGRTLYLYFENNPVSEYSLIISQESDEKHACFYPDYNFVSISYGDNMGANHIEKAKESFSVEEIERLKKANDWNMAINKEKCVKVEISHKKSDGPVNDETVMQLYRKALRADAYDFLSSITFFTTDDYNRSIYLGKGTWSSNRYVVMLFNPDGSYDENRCLMELSDLNNYQDELKAFKDLNDWNMPLE